MARQTTREALAIRVRIHSCLNGSQPHVPIQCFHTVHVESGTLGDTVVQTLHTEDCPQYTTTNKKPRRRR